MVIILDILNRFDIIVYTGISWNKNLLFQTIIWIKIGVIVYIISQTEILIEDQVDKWLILFLNHFIFNDVLVLHNTKKRD